LNNFQASKEAAEADAAKQELGLGDDPSSLQALILKRYQERDKDMDSFLDYLADKYSRTPAKKGRKPKKMTTFFHV
jgi:hypothetical protein